MRVGGNGVTQVRREAEVDPATRRRAARSVSTSASKSSIRRFVNTEKAPTRAFSW